MRLYFCEAPSSGRAGVRLGMMRPAALIAVVVAAALAGCGKSQGNHDALYPAEGQILWQGKPVAGGWSFSVRKRRPKRSAASRPRRTRTTRVVFA